MGTGRSGSEKAAVRRENQARLMDLLDWDSQTWDRWINALPEKAPASAQGPVRVQVALANGGPVVA